MIKYSISKHSAQPGVLKGNVTDYKFYGFAQTENLDLETFVKHIANHGSSYSRGTIQGVALEIVDCLREQLLEGKRVHLGPLGTFAATLQTCGTEFSDEFTSQNITAVNVNWTPGPDFQDLLRDATFECVATREAQAATLKAQKQEKPRPETNTPSDDGMKTE